MGDAHPICKDVGPKGYTCTRRPDHTGPHEARTIGIEWPQSDA